MGEDNIQRESFVFYKTFSDTLKELDPENQLKLFWAINDYALYGKEPDFNGVLKLLWIPILYQLNRNIKRYEACVRNGKKGAEFGKLGGRPKKNNPNKTPNETPNAINNNPKQKPQTEPLNDNVNDNDNNLELNKLSSLSTSVDPTAPKIEKSSKKSEIDYTALANFFNATLEKENSTIPRVQRITERRKGYIESRCREYGKEAIMKVIQLAAKSDFLNGKNNRNWKADFDWIFLPNNFPKIFEGNYNDSHSTSNKNETNGQDRFSGRRGTDTSARSAKDYEEPL